MKIILNFQVNHYSEYVRALIRDLITDMMYSDVSEILNGEVIENILNFDPNDRMDTLRRIEERVNEIWTALAESAVNYHNVKDSELMYYLDNFQDVGAALFDCLRHYYLTVMPLIFNEINKSILHYSTFEIESKDNDVWEVNLC